MKVNRIIVVMMVMVLTTAFSMPKVLATYNPIGNSYGEWVVPIEALSIDLSEDFIRQSLDSHLASVYGFEVMHNYGMALETVQSIEASFQRDADGMLLFPHYFGGMYFDSYGNAVLLVVDSITARANASETFVLATRFSGTSIDTVEFSFNNLWEMVQLLNNEVSTNPDNAAITNAGRWYLDVMRNRVIVELIDFSEDQIAIFKSTVINSPMILFEEYVPSNFSNFTVDISSLDSIEHLETLSFTHTIHPGSSFTTPHGIGSTGYRARGRDGRIGFVTAAHNTRWLSIGQNFLGVGTLVDRLSPAVDAAFIATNSNVTVTNSMGTGGNHTSMTALPWPGGPVFMRGSARPHIQWGNVRNTGVWHPQSGIFNAIIVNNPNHQFARAGDSGAVVAMSGGGVVGIVAGGSYFPSSNIPDYVVVSWSGQIGTELGVWPS